MRKSIILMIMIALLALPNVYAYCIAGIGNTCGDDSSSENFFGKYFNLEKPDEDDSFDFWGIGKTVKNIFRNDDDANVDDKPLFPEQNDYDVGDKVKNKDIEGNIVVTEYTSVSRVQASATDPWYYDIDAIGVNGFQCVGCPVDHPNIPGFDYEFAFSLKNSGNVPASDGFKIKVELKNLENGNIYYNEIQHEKGFPTGTGVISLPIYDVGYDPEQKTIDPLFIRDTTAKSESVPMKLTVKLIDDDKEVEPGFIEYIKSERVCKKITIDGISVSDCDVEKKLVREIIHADIRDSDAQDTATFEFEIKRLTAEVAAESGFDFIFR